MLGRYYEEFEIDIQRGVSNYSQLLLQEAAHFISNSNDSSPYFLYWAPDSTHGPWYSSPGFLGSSSRFFLQRRILRHFLNRASHYGDALRELDDAIGKILDQVRKARGTRATLVIFTSDNGADLNGREKAGGDGMRDKYKRQIHKILIDAKERPEKRQLEKLGHIGFAQDPVDLCSVASRQPLKEVSTQ